MKKLELIRVPHHDVVQEEYGIMQGESIFFQGTLKECTDWLIENGEFEDQLKAKTPTGFEDIDNYCKEICELTTERNMIRQSLRETSGLLHRIYLLKYPFLKHMIPMLEEMNCKLEDMYAKEAEKRASQIEKLLK